MPDSRRLLSDVWKSLVWLAWGVWWGGLCFYAVVVVPIGTDEIGTVEQGFITQRVTWWHNLISTSFLFVVAVEAYRRRSRALLICGVALGAIDLALFAWHARLTGLMDFHYKTVPASFYGQHAVYLWITAAEWFLGIVLPFWLIRTTPDVPPVSR